ncbi:MAG: hypothetical protein R2813_12320 [Flavobacteriales bacterium]
MKTQGFNLTPIALLTLLMLITNSCSAQIENGSDDQIMNDSHNTNQPDVRVSVNREYDDNGNLIRFDSTYSWSYQSKSGDEMMVNPDSVIMQFRSQFNHHFSNRIDSQFQQWFQFDPFIQQDFMSPDFFHDRWQRDMLDMDMMFRQMDSIKRQFFEDNYPGLESKQTAIKI